MPYININEYDNTLTGPKEYSSNIVVVPLNAADGPSDKWITIYTYDDFIQMFGPNPNPTSAFGNSWEYAANLLMRGMAVCVRRITHELDDDGINTDIALANVATAKNVVKVKDVIGTDSSGDIDYEVGTVTLKDANNYSTLLPSEESDEGLNPKYIFLNKTDLSDTLVAKENREIFPTVYALENYSSNLKKIIPADAFADVVSTNTEWDYVGAYENPHYKYVGTFGDNTGVDMTYLNSMNQLYYDLNTPYQLGDFYIQDVNNHIAVFNPIPHVNAYFIDGGTSAVEHRFNYPDDLRKLDTDEYKADTLDGDVSTHGINYVKGSPYFAYVRYDENGKNVDLVWKFDASQTTSVRNHKFVENSNTNIETTITITLDKKTKETTDVKVKVFSTIEELNTIDTTNLGLNYFAIVNAEKPQIYLFKGASQGWVTTNSNETAIANLADESSDFCLNYNINFVNTKTQSDTGAYQRLLYWTNLGETGEEINYEATELKEEHPEFVYRSTLYWKDSKNVIGTRPHDIKDIIINKNKVIINTNVDLNTTALTLQVNGNPIEIQNDTAVTRLTSGIYGITNKGNNPIRFYQFKIVQRGDNGEITTLYNSNIETIINSSGRIKADSTLRIYNNSTGNYLADPIPQYDENGWYFELQPNCTMQYNKNITNGTFEFITAGFEPTDYKLSIMILNSANGKYEINLYATNNVKAYMNKYYIPVVTEDEINYNDIPMLDNNGNFNLFIVEYLYPGTNGNFINVRIKCTPNQGIFMYIYRNNQFLEKIELCSFRFRDAKTGRINILDEELNKDGIWKTILSKFGILLLDDGQAYNNDLTVMTDVSDIKSIITNYVKISINPNIIIYQTHTSLDYVQSLYAQSGNAITYLKNGNNPTDDCVLHEVNKCYKPLEDKYRYDITFVTNGGFVDEICYPKNIMNVFATETDMRLIEDAMFDLANTRKDCVAFVDVPYELPLADVPSYFEHISTSYAAAYDPWAYMLLSTGSTKWMPPSFVQLYTHAKSIQNGNKMYLPPAGVRRAMVPEIIKTNHDLSSTYIQTWQDENTPQFINPIIWINGFDFTVYGQKTLYNVINDEYKYQSALQDLNVRLVANVIKKLIFKTCIELTFELNNIMTWNEFKSKITPTLLAMQGEGVLTDYNVIMGKETMTSADLNSGHVVGTVRVSIARAATDWDINFELTPNSITFNEADYNSSYSD